MTPQGRSKPEASTFVDPLSGRTIWRLTNSSMEDKHSYYDISPWRADQKYLVFSCADPADLTVKQKDTLATPKGQVYLLDMQTYALDLLAEPAFFNTHTGAFALWHPTRPLVYFNQAPNKAVAINTETRVIEETVEGGIRQLSPDGQKFASTNNDLSDQSARRGVYTTNADGTERQLIVPLETLYELTPNKETFLIDQMTVGNTKWTPDSQHMLVAMWVKGSPDDLSPWQSPHRRSIYIVSRDGAEVRWLTYFGHHHSWTADGESVLYSGYKYAADDGARVDPRLYLIDFDGSNKRMVIDEPLGGHPIANPAGTMITTWDDKGVILVRVSEQRVEYLASLEPTFDQSHQGTHPHCVWSPDGRQILYNSAQTGHSQLYLIPIES